MTRDQIEEWLAAHPEVKSVIVALCDINGAMRGKRIPITQIDKVLNNSVRMPVSAATLDIWGRDIQESVLVFETGDADGICELTDRGVLLCSWLESPTILLPVWMRNDDGSPLLSDPRRALEAVLERYHAKGLRPVVATELEFYLVDVSDKTPKPPQMPDTSVRLHSDDVLSIRELDAFSPFLNDVYAACEEQGIPADAAISENGAGQFEINLLHRKNPLRAADDAVFFKRIVHGVARKHGWAATFMAKPYGNRAGNGMHVHFSVIDEAGANIFDNGTEEGSPALRHAVGGLLEAMAESTLIFAPHQNSYRRIRPESHAPTSVAWGYENRTAAIRIPGGDPAAKRIEHRVAGADANPYLVLASILGAALIGMERKVAPSDPIEGDAYSADAPQLPLDWPSAIRAFEQGPYSAQIYDPELHRLFVQTKDQELRRFLEIVTEFEYLTYLETV